MLHLILLMHGVGHAVGCWMPVPTWFKVAWLLPGLGFLVGNWGLWQRADGLAVRRPLVHGTTAGLIGAGIWAASLRRGAVTLPVLVGLGGAVVYSLGEILRATEARGFCSHCGTALRAQPKGRRPPGTAST